MSLIKPFRSLRPAPGRAADILAPPYDVLSSAEARERAAGKPWSFLHISKPEIDLDIRGSTDATGNLVAVRHFDTADELRADVVNARTWGGLHYRFSTEAGVQLGQKVAHYGLNHAFKATH